MLNGNLAAQLFATWVRAGPAEQRALAAGHDTVAAARDGHRDERRHAGVADPRAAHLARFNAALYMMGRVSNRLTCGYEKN